MKEERIMKLDQFIECEKISFDVYTLKQGILTPNFKPVKPNI